MSIFSLHKAGCCSECSPSRMIETPPMLHKIILLALAAGVVVIVASVVVAFTGNAEAQMSASPDVASVESALIQRNAEKRDAGLGKSSAPMSIASDMCTYGDNTECTHVSASHDELYYDNTATIQQRYSTMMASKCCSTYTTSYSYTITCSGSLWEYWYDGGTMTGAEERWQQARIIFKPKTREYVVRTAGRGDIYFALVGGRYSAMTQPVPTRYEVYCPSDTRATGALAFWEETQYYNVTERAVSTYVPPLQFGSPTTETFVSKTTNRRRHMCPEDNPCPWLVLNEGGKG